MLTFLFLAKKQTNAVVLSPHHNLCFLQMSIAKYFEEVSNPKYWHVLGNISL